MTWLLEERMPIILVGASATVIMVLVVIFTRRLPALLGLLGVILLTGLLLVVELLVVTEVETIENMLYQGAESLEQNDIPAVLAHISPTAEPIRQQAERLFSDFTFFKVGIGYDLYVTIDHQAQQATATARFTCHAKLRHRSEIMPYEKGFRRVTVILVREGDRWLVTDYELRR